MKSIKLKNDYYLDSTSVSHNRKKLSEQIHYHNVTTGQITESGRVIDNKKEYMIRMNLGKLPNTTSKTVTLPISIKNVLVTRPIRIWGLNEGTSETEYMTETNNPTYFINNNIMNLSSTNDRSRFTGYLEIYFIYK